MKSHYYSLSGKTPFAFSNGFLINHKERSFL